jgi:hypothetical protein
MIGEGTRQFDLYDFFSIFIPGVTFLLALVPFLPRDQSLPTLGIVGLVLIGGFVVGRVVHALRILIEDWANLTTHRDYFINEITNPRGIDSSLVERFYETAKAEFDHAGLPDWDNIDKNKHTDELETLYTLTRSAIHIDSRGRSRTFQAIYDFYTSMMIASSAIALLYLLYSLIQGFDLVSSATIGFKPYITILDVHWLVLLFITLTAYNLLFYISRQMRTPYRRYFIQYLISDFIVLQTSTGGGSN